MANTKLKKIVGLREFRENVESYIAEVNNGRTFTIVRRSEPVFKISPVDEWGDEGTWETVVDFTKIKRGGVKIEDILKRL